MFDKIKTVFNKRFLVFSLILLVAAFIAPVFALKSNNNSTQAVIQTNAYTSIEEMEEEYETDDFLTINYQPNKSNPQISLLGWENDSRYDNDGKISGGEEITISVTSTSASIQWPGNKKTYTPNKGYEMVAIKVYDAKTSTEATSSNLKKTITAGSTGVKFKPEEIVATYSHPDDIFIQAVVKVINYDFELFYHTGDDSSSYSYKTVTYNIKNSVDLTGSGSSYDDDIVDDNDVPIFSYWMVKASAISSNKYNGYDITISEVEKTIEITKGEEAELVFKFSNIITVNEVNGSGDVQETIIGYELVELSTDTETPKTFSYGDFNQDSDNPLLVANINRTYKLSLQNRDTTNVWYYEDFDKDNKAANQGDFDDAGVLTSKELTGAVASEDSDASSFAVGFDIKDKEDYAYPFMDGKKEGQSVPFYKPADYDAFSDVKATVSSDTNKYYYVYAYGYEIIGWRLGYSTDSSNTWRFASIYNNTLCFAQNSIYVPADTRDLNIDIADLNGTTTKHIASFLDNKFAGVDIETEDIVIVMKPIWNAAPVSVSLDGKTNVTSNDNACNPAYNTSYNIESLNTSVQQNGESVINYKTQDGSIIVLNGKYNYTNIAHNQYKYDTTKKRYVLSVSPEYVDNMYKVNLSGVSGHTFVGSASSPAYATSTGYSANVYTYSDYTQSGYAFVNYSHPNPYWIEDYITNTFATLKESYVRGIAGDFVILNKVYGSGTLYIYLTNDHPYNVPVYTRDYYDLIFYENNANTAIKYKTAVYDAATGSELAAYQVASGGYEFAEHPHWNLDDGGSQGSLQINAYWFRKYYNLDISTLFNGAESFHGYVRVDITDEQIATGVDGCQSASYVVLYHDGGMKIYSISPSLTTMKDHDFTTYETETGGSPTEYIRLYAGCSIEISVYDQSQDTSAALEDDNFVDMVGYKYISVASSTVSLFEHNHPYDTEEELDCEDCVDSRYAIERNEDCIEALDLDTGVVIDFNAEFAEIEYGIDVALNKPRAGNFVVVFNAVYSQQVDEYSIEDINLGEIHTIEYNASAGYEFMTNAFTLRNYSVVLQGISTYIIDGKEYFNQTYNLEFTSSWLRDFYYTNFDTAFSVDDTEIGTIYINTQVIEFDIGYKLYDSTKDDGANKGIFAEEILTSGDDALMEKFSLNVDTAYGKLSPLNSFVTFADIDGRSNFFIEYNGERYALLNTRMYNVNNYLTTNSNHYTAYNFPLKTMPTTEFMLDPSIISAILGCYEIIPVVDRVIYVMFEVREASVITISVDYSNEKDPNNDRYTTISNTVGNYVSIDKYGAEIYEEGSFVGYESVTLYSYQGLKNTMTSVFNIANYSHVEYTLDGTLLTENNFFTTQKTHALVIKYEVNSLMSEIVYKLDGVEITEDEVIDEGLLSDMLLVAYDKEGNPANIAELYLSDEIVYSYKLVDQDYFVTIEINSEVHTNMNYDDTADVYSLSRTIIASDYDDNRTSLQIIVNITSLPRNSIQVIMALIHPEQRVENEPAYGEVTVYVNGSVKADENADANIVEVTVITGRKVELELSLNEGYKYYGFKHDHNAINTDRELNENKLLITNSYNLDREAGCYYVYVEKISLTAVLEIKGEYKGYALRAEDYSPTVSPDKSKYTIEELFVNKTVQFVAVEGDREVLDYFYYKTGAGVVQYITSDSTATGEPVMEFVLTSEILEKLSKESGVYIINFGVVGTPKYKLDFSVRGTENIKEDGFKSYVNDDESKEFKSGEFYVVNTKINFDIETLREGKYHIAVKINGETQSLVDVLHTYYILDQDLVIEFNVYAKYFGVTVNENIYNNLYDFNNNNPTPVDTEDMVNNANISGLYYDYASTIQLSTVSEGCELYSITLSGNEEDDLIIKIINGELKYFVEDAGGDLVESASNPSGYTIEYDGIAKTISIKYITVAEVTITFDYIDYKNISSKG